MSAQSSREPRATETAATARRAHRTSPIGQPGDRDKMIDERLIPFHQYAEDHGTFVLAERARSRPRPSRGPSRGTVGKHRLKLGMRSAFSFAKKRQGSCLPTAGPAARSTRVARPLLRPSSARADRRRALPLDEHQRSPRRRQNAASAGDCGSPGPSGGRSCRGREQPPRRHGRHARSRTKLADSG